MKRSFAPHLTRTRRRALAVPFVITLAATGSACGDGTATIPIGDRPDRPGDVVSNPAEPEQRPTDDATIVVSNPAPPSDG